jgi:hypothetical protein
VPPSADALTPRRLVVGALALLVVLVGAAVVLTRVADDDAEPAGRVAPTVPPVDEAAARAFVEAWRRSLTGTYMLESAFERETRGGGRFESESVTVQRPPDRVATGAGSVDARVDGRRLACATDADGVLQCRDGGPASSYAEFVDLRVARVAELVEGENALYAVEAQPERCFRLTLRASLPAPPYGLLARFCFDTRTGAPTSSEIRREDSVDRTRLVRLSGEVRDEHLRLPGVGERRGP